MEEFKENIVVDYSGKEILIGDKVKFIIETLDGYQEYWIGHVVKINEFDADADDDGNWYGIEPSVVIEYVDCGVMNKETYPTHQDRSNTDLVFVCEELEII